MPSFGGNGIQLWLQDCLGIDSLHIEGYIKVNLIEHE